MVFVGHPRGVLRPDDDPRAGRGRPAVWWKRSPRSGPAARRTSARSTGTWSLVHGLSTLLLDERLGTRTRAEAGALVETVVRTMLGTGPERPDG
ncbi:hypothetical protein [Streptomyces sp. NEAU-YJ-81]|uniref:hypothetical protein n=1 Tax=Streptomyces sp. NEAU-YJ-81 TaxID=2820288 RepID=UPI001FB92DA2|nr:hypothetical protein [Streptomyces sp. NEAU-YJ-81]